MLLTLYDDGGVTVREQGVLVLKTRFRAGRDRSAAGMPLVIWFEDPVANGTRFRLPTEPTDTLLFLDDMACSECPYFRMFVRVR